MQLSGPCKEKQRVYNALTSAYSGGNSEYKSKCLPLMEVFSVILLPCYLIFLQVFALVGWTVQKAVPDV